eukprot:CAMPEP_0196575364 /NCGR_PEP_ID=MMETSP1081-20130531/4857_1 /TAXON_ID=36882 /ORGANISM="Pyramimonas amylifera, Strain CCMP720" /LENGTH=320 /DNA_ID=CAMNT_0041893645 /DNA_START=390 /DNA_END=1349 /DNA_ORIENTATION=-
MGSESDFGDKPDPDAATRNVIKILGGGDKNGVVTRAEQSSLVWKIKAKDQAEEKAEAEALERANRPITPPSPTASEKQWEREERTRWRRESLLAQRREARRAVELAYWEPVLKDTRERKHIQTLSQQRSIGESKAADAARWQAKCDAARQRMERQVAKQDKSTTQGPEGGLLRSQSPDRRLDWMKKGVQTREKFRSVRLASPTKYPKHIDSDIVLPSLKGAVSVNLKAILPFPNSQSQNLEAAVWLNTSGFNRGDFNLHSNEYSRTILDPTAVVHPTIAREQRGYSRRHNGILRVGKASSPRRKGESGKWNPNWYRTDAW